MNDYLLLMGVKGLVQYRGSLEDCFLIKHLMILKGYYYLWVCEETTFNELGV